MANGYDDRALNALALLAVEHYNNLGVGEETFSEVQRETFDTAKGLIYINEETREFSEANYENGIPTKEVIFPNLSLEDETEDGNWVEALVSRGAFLKQLQLFGYDIDNPVDMPGAYGPTGFGGIKFIQQDK